MAKGKPKPKATPKGDGIDYDTPLTDAEIVSMVVTLVGTSKNVYDLARLAFRKTIQDGDWDRLKKAGAFKCVECNEWKPTDDEDETTEDICVECMDALDGTDLES